MKVTQEKFDDKRKELANIQDDLQYHIKCHREFFKSIETQTKARNLHGDQIVSLENREIRATCWLRDADIEKDLSVEVTKAHPYLKPMMIGKYANKGYMLDQVFDWNFTQSEANNILLIPTKKP